MNSSWRFQPSKRGVATLAGAAAMAGRALLSATSERISARVNFPWRLDRSILAVMMEFSMREMLLTRLARNKRVVVSYSTIPDSVGRGSGDLH